MRRLSSLEACRTRGRGNDRTPRSYGIERARGSVNPSFQRMIFASEAGFDWGALPVRPQGARAGGGAPGVGPPVRLREGRLPGG